MGDDEGKIRSSDLDLNIDSRFLVSRREQIDLMKECILDAMHFPERPRAIPTIAGEFFQYRVQQLHDQKALSIADESMEEIQDE